MKFKSNHITRVENPRLPDDIIVGVQVLLEDSSQPTVLQDYRKAERNVGRELIRRLVREEIGEDEFVIFGSPNQKPQGMYDGNPLNISISHVGGLIGGVISEKRVCGLDLEKTDRRVHPDLKKRILHPEEEKLVEGRIPVLQLWTIKEAALKWCGTGLRTAMSNICITDIDSPVYHAVFNDGKQTEICSFEYHQHWMSIAY